MARQRDAALNVKIGGSSAAFEAAMSKAEKRLTSFGSQMKSIGTNLSTYVSAPLAALGGFAVRAAAQIETAEVAFTGLLRSSEKAGKMVKDILSYAARTPFQVAGLQSAARLMLTFGFEAERVIPILGTVGDAVAAMGGGTDEFNGVVRALGQIQTKGKVSAEELMQLAERGIPAYEILREKLGLTAEEVANIGNAGIKADVAVNAILQGLQERFAGAASNQANTLTGLWSTAVDNITITLSKLGAEIVETFNLKGVMQAFITGLQNITAQFEKLSPAAKRTVIIMSALAAAIGPVAVAIGVLAKGIPIFTQGLRAIAMAASPVVLTIAGITAAVVALGLVLKSAYDAFEGFRNVVTYVINDIKAALQGWYTIFKSVFGPIVDFLDNALGGAFSGMKDTFDDVFSSDAAQSFGDAFMNNLDAIKEGFTGMFSGILSEAEDAGKKISDALAGGGTTFDIPTPTGIRKPAALSNITGAGAATIPVEPASGLPQRTAEDVQEVADRANEIVRKFQYITQEAQAMNQAVSNAVTDMAMGIADAFGDMFSNLNTGGNVLANFGRSIFSTLAKVAQQLGKTAISIGVAVSGIKAAIQTLNPAAAIIGGIALVAVGKLLESGLANMVPSLAVGTNMVKSDGLAQLHRGEAVVPANVVGGGFRGNASFSMKPVNIGRELLLYIEQEASLQNRKFG